MLISWAFPAQAQENWFGNFEYEKLSKADIAVALQFELINSNRQWILLHQKDASIALQQPLSRNLVAIYQYLLSVPELQQSQLYGDTPAEYYCMLNQGYQQIATVIDANQFVYTANSSKDKKLFNEIKRRFARLAEHFSCSA